MSMKNKTWLATSRPCFDSWAKKEIGPQKYGILATQHYWVSGVCGKDRVWVCSCDRDRTDPIIVSLINYTLKCYPSQPGALSTSIHQILIGAWLENFHTIQLVWIYRHTHTARALTHLLTLIEIERETQVRPSIQWIHTQSTIRIKHLHRREKNNNDVICSNWEKPYLIFRVGLSIKIYTICFCVLVNMFMAYILYTIAPDRMLIRFFIKFNNVGSINIKIHIEKLN